MRFTASLRFITSYWKKFKQTSFIKHLPVKALCNSRLRYRVVPTATVPAEVVPAESVVMLMSTTGSTRSVTVPSVGSTLQIS